MTGRRTRGHEHKGFMTSGDHDMLAGGAGGTAALIAARAAPAGFCSDTGGSCRVPAALNGIVGQPLAW